MRLSEFLAETDQNASTFAAALGVPVSTVTRWLRGDRLPSLSFLHRIHEVTEGKVSAIDFAAAGNRSRPQSEVAA